MSDCIQARLHYVGIDITASFLRAYTPIEARLRYVGIEMRAGLFCTLTIRGIRDRDGELILTADHYQIITADQRQIKA